MVFLYVIYIFPLNIVFIYWNLRGFFINPKYFIMKKINQFFLFLTLLIMFAGLTASESSAQEYYYLNGYQTKGSGTNAKLECDGIIIYRTLTVVEINGDNDGFWITDGTGSVLAKYWNTNDSDALYLQFEPGTYYIYPNLKTGQTKASVQLVFQEF